MDRPRTTAAVLGTAVLAVLAVLGSARPAGSAPPAPPAPAAVAPASAPGGVQQVTLLSGDRVLVRPGGQVDVRPAAGRSGMRFSRFQERGHTYVVPADAAGPIRRGTLDRRLFDVTRLLADGYGDADRDSLPLIVTHAAAAGPAARAEVAAAGGTAVRALPGAAASTLIARKRDTTRLWNGLVGSGGTRRVARADKVWLDAKVRATLDRSVPQIGAPAAWQAGWTGRGSTVAVLDTGLDAGHPDLAGAVTGAQDFTESGTTQDGHGHGTHVASIVTGSGAASDGRYAGVAPDAKLLVGKVLDDDGSGTESWVIAGMAWAAAQHADVVNMSLGSPFGSSDDPMSQELDRLTLQTGTLFVVSAGNDGPSAGTLGSPGVADEALTVGAVDAADALADFSSRGPRTGDEAIKPDLTAPGVDIVAARAAGSELGEPVGDAYQRLSGTSMAAPHVAGAAAILAGQHPTWTAEQLKAALTGSAQPSTGATVDAQGAGRVDVARAVAQPAYATPASLSEGVARWPHPDDAAITRTLTYHNDGPVPLVLDLNAGVRGPGGDPAPAGMFTLSAASVTVPANGSAEVTLTTRTALPGPDGRYAGMVTATGRDGHTVLRTPVAVTREVESYDVTIRATDRTGAATGDWYAAFADLDRPQQFEAYDESGTTVARLPKGRYYLDATVWPAELPEEPGALPDIALVVEPTFVVAGDRRLTLDARAAKPVGLRADRPAEPGEAVLSFERTTASGSTGSSLFARDFSGVFVRPSQSRAPGRFTFGLTGVLARPDGGGGFRGSPYQYHLSSTVDGRVPATLIRHVPDRELAVNRTTLAAPAPGLTGVKDGIAERALPAVLTEFYSPGQDWYGDLAIYPGRPDDGWPAAVFYGLEPRRYAAGDRTTDEWARGVLSPSLRSRPGNYQPSLARIGDTISGDPDTVDTAGHLGFMAAETSTSELYRNGELVPSTYPFRGYWDVPAEPATYRVVTDEPSALPGSVSSRVRTEWTFRSGHSTADPWTTLPARAVRFGPALDAHNSAPGGRSFAVPVRIEQQAGASGYGAVRTFAVKVSYDEGASWQSVPVTDGRLLLRHPAGPGSVSFRAVIEDSAGNRTEQTVIRAYLLR